MIVFAHRGYSIKYPESTGISYRAALDAGATGIEADLQLTKDGQWVIFHDRDIHRIMSRTGAIADFPLADLKKMDAGSWKSEEFRDERILTLKELLSIVIQSGKNPVLNLELKRRQKIEDRSLEKLLDQVHSWSKVLFSSFDPEVLSRISKINSEYPLGIIVEHGEILLELPPVSSIHPALEILNETNVTEWKKKGWKIYPWTVDREIDMAGVMEKGVDGFFTDDPETALRVLKKTEKFNE